MKEELKEFKNIKNNIKRKVITNVIFVSLMVVGIAFGILFGVISKTSMRQTVVINKDNFSNKDDIIVNVDGTYTTITSGGYTSEDGDIDDGGSGGDTPNTPSTPIDTTDTQKYVYQTLRSWGYDNEAIAGIMGNMNAESGIKFGTTQSHTHDNATNVQCQQRGCIGNGGGNAHGIVQWDKGRKDNLISGAIQSGVEWTSPEYQMGFLKNEIIDGSYNRYVSPSSIYNGRTSEDKVEYATYMWCRRFEICSGVHQDTDTFASRLGYSHWSDRLGAAMEIYSKITSGQFN